MFCLAMHHCPYNDNPHPCQSTTPITTICPHVTPLPQHAPLSYRRDQGSAPVRMRVRGTLQPVLPLYATVSAIVSFKKDQHLCQVHPNHPKAPHLGDDDHDHIPHHLRS